MTCTVNSTTTDTMTLDEYIDFCESHPEMQEPDAAIEYADRLKALCNNKQFLTDYLNQELKQLNQFQSHNDFTPSAFIFHYGSYFSVRCVVWLPIEELGAEELLSYYDGHDHSFDFLTCGLHGSGYQTKIYQYDADTVAGYIGEKVNIDFLESTDFPEGKLMYYFASKDIHTQYPPEELSISANLILPRKSPKLQYFFDLEKQTISSHVNKLSLRTPIFEAVAATGDENSIDLLLRIASQHPCFRTRSMAWSALAQLQHGLETGFYEQAMADSHPYVKQAVHKAMSPYH